MKKAAFSAVELAVIVLFSNPIIAVPSEYSTIQETINASNSSDAAITTPGTYIGNGNRDIDLPGNAITATNTNPQDYVPNEIIVKLRPGVINNTNQQSTKSITWPDSLEQLNNKYKHVSTHPLNNRFDKNEQQIKNPAAKDLSQLSLRERHLVARAKRAPKGAVVPNLGNIFKIRFALDANESIQNVLDAYRRDPAVEYAELNYIMHFFLLPGDTYYSVEWALNNTGQPYPIPGGQSASGTPGADISVPEAWDIYTGSSDVIVAVVDSGVDYTHRDLAAKMWVDQNDYYGYDFGNNDNDPTDELGHGTHCAGIIAADTDNGQDIAGVCWNARIMAVKCSDTSNLIAVDYAVGAIHYAVDNGADIISCSWGGTVYSQSLEEAINYAYNRGVIVVAAAGNDNSSSPSYPAYYEHVISAAATDSSDNKASFSNYGEWIDLAAPGVDILSLRAKNTDMYLGTQGYIRGDRFIPFANPHATMYIASGTSMACPQVAGACALLLSANPALTVNEVNDILSGTVDSIADGICRSDGRLNVFRALKQTINSKSKGNVALDSAYYGCDSNIGVFLSDGDLSSEMAHSVNITAGSGDVEIINLNSKYPSVGAFGGTIRTQAGEPSIGDGVLQVTNGDIVTVFYSDADDGTGNPATATDTAAIDCVPPVISNVQTEIKASNLTVTFNSNEPAAGKVFCGTVCGGLYNLEGANPALKRNQQIELFPLEPFTTYYFIVTAADAAGNQAIDSNSGNCFSFTTSGPGYMNVPGQFATIQQAIDYAWEGSTIIVADGVYTGQGNRDIDFLGKAITVKSENGPDNCIIDCQANENDPHRGFYFKSGEGPDSIIDGFTITNGFGPSDFWDGYEFRKVGGALHLYYSSPTIKNCRIIANRTSYCNGCADGLGGGVFCDHSNSVIMNCELKANTTGYGDGGAVYGRDSDISIINCQISDNHGSRGCGINIEGGSPSIDGCVVRGNESDGGGRGSLYFEDSSPTITNCLITGNKAYPGGICSWNGGGYATINNCTIVNNTEAAWGGAIYWDDSASVTNCICRGNHSAGLTGGYREIYKENVTVNYTNIQDNSDPSDWKYVHGTGNIDAAPLFLAAGFYYLGPGSPCIDTGTNSPPGGLSDTDIDGTVRPIDGDNDGISIADMGCYEFNPDLPPVIWFSQEEFSFVAVEGGPNPASQILSVRNIGTGTLNWSVSENCDWLQAEPASGQSSGETDEVTLSINTSGLSSGTYQCILSIKAEGAVNNPQTVWINLFVGKSQIELSANNFAFTGIHNLSNPPPQTLTIRNSGVGTLNWTIDSGCEWLVADPCYGSSAGETDNVILNVNSSGLDVGAYNCTLTVSDPCASNSPQTINITLDVYNPNYDGILSVPSEYTTIQEAIDQALDGNTVLVADGTYTGPGNRDIDFKGKAITVKSENGPENCIINCNGTYTENHRGFYFHNGEGRNSLLEGFTITNAYVVVFGEGGAGININGASPVINNCIVTNNHTELDPMSGSFCQGGGIFISDASNPLIANCIITDNSVGNWGWGGGIYCTSPYTTKNLTIQNCLISNNTAIEYQSMGGGIYCEQLVNLNLVNCTIANNFSTNEGGGVFFMVYNSPIRTITNSIFWGNSPDQVYAYDTSNIIVSYTDIQNGWTGTGNINADPCFVVGPDGDYYLSQVAAGQIVNSPCVNEGSDTAANLGMDSKTTRTDEIGDNGIVDMGYHYPNCYGSPDLNRDAFIDFFDYALLANDWLLFPDPCDPNSGDITKDGQVNIYDLTQQVKFWLNCLVTSANNPQPADNATDISRNVVLRWSPGENTVSHDVYFGTSLNEVYNADTSSAQFMGNQDVNYWDSNSYSPDGLDANKTYYWRIDEAGPVCIAKGNVWRFTTMPLPPEQSSNPVPTDGATEVSITTDLSWTAGDFATSHNVYFGTTNPPPFKVNQTGTTYYTGTMDTNTIYYWRIDEKNSRWTTTGNIWSFTTEVVFPGQASNPSPVNEATNVSIVKDINWTAGNFATSHDVYFGTINPPPFIGNQTSTIYDTGTMDTNTTYYWRIDEKNTSGTTIGNIWSFTTIVQLPGQATNPIPADTAIGIGIMQDLIWTAGSYATSHDVYFGTTNPPPFKVNQTSTTYDTGTMDVNTTYYWRIDEKNRTGTTIGNIWNFKTESSQKITASDGAGGDSFGFSVSISGDRCIVGAVFDDDKGTNSGSAYIFEWNSTSWIQKEKLTASDGASSDLFGHSSIDGDRCIVGAYGDDDKGSESGSAYIFKWNGSSWIQEAKLTASDGATGDYFGHSVSISGDRCIVGAQYDDDKGTESGSAYIFKWNGSSWIQEAKLTASDGASSDSFGHSVRISGDRCIVGAHGDDDNSGSAYIFEWNGTSWIQKAKMTASDGASSDYFGYSVSISGDRCIVGAYGDDDKGSYSGSAYIFEWNGTSWIQKAKLSASDGAGGDYFGFSVSISGDRCIVGAYYDDDKGFSSGSAYIFEWNGTSWIQKAKLTASDGASSDFFGRAVSIDGDRCIVGACYDDDKGSESGSAYIYEPGP